MRRPNVLRDKSFTFALDMIKLYKLLTNNNKEYVLSRQLLRSGTAIGALIRESENAASTKDFVNKLTIALKEADESLYWLELLYHSEYIANETFHNLSMKCNELISMLVASVKTVKTKMNSPL